MVSYSDSWMEVERHLGKRWALKGNIEEMHAQFDELVSFLAPQCPSPSTAVSTTEGMVNGTKYRVYSPKTSETHPLPVGIYLHGGGFVLGDLEIEDGFCRMVAEHLPTIIVSVDYKLAPQHTCATQLQDAVKVFEWAYQNTDSYGGDKSKAYAIGNSAGGCLALALTRYMLLHPLPTMRGTLKGTVAIVPPTLHPDNVPDKYEQQYTAMREFRDNNPIIDQSSVRSFYEYAQVQPNDDTILTALAINVHSNFPPTYIATCECDPLRDDGRIMAQILRSAGVPVRENHYKGLPHIFWYFPIVLEGQDFYQNTLAGIRWVIDQM
ncbi:MAG: hypothetical protein Q9227_006726 [Pyrenula ochraceoflavens]